MEPKINTVCAKEIKMRYFTFGEGTKDMVILPGLSIIPVMESAKAVADAYAMFGKEYRVWVFERRENLPDEYSVEEMANDTAKIMKSLNIKDACIFGTSQGGMMAQVIAIRYPELVRKMILASTCADTASLDGESAIGEWIDLAEKKKIHELNRSLAEKIYAPETVRRFKEVFDGMEEAITEERLARFLILARGIKEFNISGSLNAIRCPVLVLGSVDDKVIDSALMEKLAEEAGAQIYLYKGYGHAVYDEAPDFKERIMEFFRAENA